MEQNKVKNQSGLEFQTLVVELKKLLIQLWHSPITTIKKYLDNKDDIFSFVFLGLNALFFSLFGSLVFKKVIQIILSSFRYRGFINNLNCVKVFFILFILKLIFSGSLIVTTWFLGNKIGRNEKASFKKSFSLISICSVPMSISHILSLFILLLFGNGNFGFTLSLLLFGFGFLVFYLLYILTSRYFYQTDINKSCHYLIFSLLGSFFINYISFRLIGENLTNEILGIIIRLSKLGF